MVSFCIPNSEDEGPATSSVILRFELVYLQSLGNGYWSQGQDSGDMDLVPIHEFRIPHRALLGLHSYCPVHFEAFHSALVDLTIHIVYLQAGVTKPSSKVQRHWNMHGLGSKSYDIMKALLISREMLLEEVKKISKGIGSPLEDLDDVDLSLGKYEAFHTSKSGFSNYTRKQLASTNSPRQLTVSLRDFLEISDGVGGSTNDIMVYTLSKDELLDLFETVSCQLSFVWNAFLKFHRINRIKILDYLHAIWDDSRKAEWSIWMIHSKIDIPHRYMQSMTNDSSPRLLRISSSRKLHQDPIQNSMSRAELHRRSIAKMKIDTKSIQDMHIYGDPSCVPVLRIEHHIMDVPQHSSEPLDNITAPPQQREECTARKPGDVINSGHIFRAVIFVHGFQGNHLDLRLIRNQWLLLDPGAECLLSQINEDRTTGDFKEMGRRLANEVAAFLKRKMDKHVKSGGRGWEDMKLSFVGHSIGNIILRSALTEPKLEPFLKNLHTYMSISGPHLGYWYSSNSLFNSGLWLMKRLKGMRCMHQLTFSDDQDPQNTFLYKLCKLKTLENFKNIILVSSPQDGYVPYHSARIDLCNGASSDTSRKGRVFTEMLNACLDQIRAPPSAPTSTTTSSAGGERRRRVFMRCDVHFDLSARGRSLNTVVGRAAHIEFLEDDVYARFIMWSFPDLFR